MNDPVCMTEFAASEFGIAPNKTQEPPPPCQAKILNATNNQFATNYTNSNVTSTFNYSTGAGPGQGTFHIDSGYPVNPIGAAFHWLLNMTKAGGYPKC